jgi:hypothetical protein
VLEFFPWILSSLSYPLFSEHVVTGVERDSTCSCAGVESIGCIHAGSVVFVSRAR